MGEKRCRFFKDLEIDSLLALEILALIEKKFKVQIPEEKLVDITSLNATIEMTRSTLEENEKIVYNTSSSMPVPQIVEVVRL